MAQDKHDKWAKKEFAWLREAGFRPEGFSFEVKPHEGEKPDNEGLYIELLAQMHRKYNPEVEQPEEE